MNLEALWFGDQSHRQKHILFGPFGVLPFATLAFKTLIAVAKLFLKAQEVLVLLVVHRIGAHMFVNLLSLFSFKFKHNVP